MKARVHIFYKDGVFDPQGNTVAHSLKGLGFSSIQEVRIGRVIDLDLQGVSLQAARQQVKDMCEKLLANPVIESYQFDIQAEQSV